MRILIAAATTAEIAPLLRQLSVRFHPKTATLFSGSGLEMNICVTGVGIMQTTYRLTESIHRFQPDFALQAGVAGVFDKKLPLGTVVAVGTEILGDLGAEDQDHFWDVFELGLATEEAPFSRKKLVNPLTGLPADITLPVVPSLTVNCVAGSRETIRRRQEKYDSTLESMEGAAFHFICLTKKIPFLQVRCISNDIIPRDKSTWELEPAIQNLNKWLVDYLFRIDPTHLSSGKKVD